MSLHSPTAIKTLPDFRLWMRFSDGVEGAADLSALVGKGVFERWKNRPASFENVVISEDGSLLWDETVDLCSDALYLQISRKAVEDVFPRLKQELLHA